MAGAEAIGRLFGPLGGLAALGFAAAGFYVLFDRLGLFGNGWLRQRVQEKLTAFGDLPFAVGSPAVRFVGLAYPVREGWLRAETDDDVGFLEITEEGLRYRGDALSFDVPAEALEEVSLDYRPPAFKRLRLRFRDGEPFDSVCLDSRDHNRLFAAKRDNTALYRALRALIQRCSTKERLAAPVEAMDTTEVVEQRVTTDLE
jgi:hypothetical protein